MVGDKGRAPSRPSLDGAGRDGSGLPSALVFAVGAVALWSTNALVGKSLLASHPVSLVQLLQFCGATLVFAVIHLASRKKVAPENAASTAQAVAVGIIGLVGTMVLQYIAFASMPVIEANLVAYTWPLMVAAAVIVLGKPQRPVLLGSTAVLGFVGVALVISGGRGQPFLQGSIGGYLAAFGSALCMSLIFPLSVFSGKMTVISFLVGRPYSSSTLL